MTITHGYAGMKSGRRPRTYVTWQSMLQRCHNPNATSYKRYGALGVRVCDRWQGPDGFANFLADMGERPEGMSLDRIKSDGDYTHLNCRWATAEEQARNRRNSKLESHEFDQIRWLAALGTRQRTIAEFYGVVESHVSAIVHGRRKAA